MKKTLVIISSNVAHGAEQVLMDTLSDASMAVRFDVLGPNAPEIRNEFISRGINYRICDWLSPVGAGRSNSILNIFKKLFHVVAASVKIASIARQYHLVIGNNTGDALWAPTVRLTGKPFHLWVHDDKYFPALGLCLKITRPFVVSYIACSKSVKRSLQETVGKSIKINVIHNGLEDLPWEPKEHPPTLRIGWIGSMEDRKDPLFFVEMIRQVVAAGDSVAASMVFKPIDRRLEDSVREASAGLPIELIGPLPRDQVQTYFSNIDILAVTSKSDPLPTVIIEAYRAGVPVIARDIPSLRDMVDSGKTGCLFDHIMDLQENFKTIKNGIDAMSKHSRIEFLAKYDIKKKRDCMCETFK